HGGGHLPGRGAGHARRRRGPPARMTTTVRLLAASLHYPPDLVLHTASSGRIGALDELYLVIERDGALAGFGEIRENVAYLTGLEPATVRQGVTALAGAVDWAARERGLPVTEVFGAPFRPAHTTNQSLFVSDDAHLLAMAERYVSRGFRKLKLRVGA